ncbi:MAG TPA: hypothetical protein VIU63_01100 [Nitrospira sp.]
MRARTFHAYIRLLVLGMIFGCSEGGKELSLASYNASLDQRRIAGYHLQEADRLRQQAAELKSRIELYERLFGKQSDWVVGTRLLAESYREAADEQERLAMEHLEVIHSSQR